MPPLRLKIEIPRVGGILGCLRIDDWNDVDEHKYSQYNGKIYILWSLSSKQNFTCLFL